MQITTHKTEKAKAKILILGESNSVYADGWVAGFSDQLRDRFVVENKSLGSTGIFNAIFNLCRIGSELAQYSAIIIDSSIQDATFYKHRVAFYCEVLDALLADLASFPGAICYLQFESLTKDPFEAAFYQHVRQYLEKKNVLFQNFNQLVAEQQSAKKIEDFRFAYSDNHHIHRKLAYGIGAKIAEKIDTGLAKQAALPTRVRSSVTQNQFLNVLDLDALKFRGNIRCGRIQNALVDVDTIKITSEGLSLQIDSERQGDELIGIIFNAPSSNGFLRISSNTTLHKNLSNNTKQYWGEKLIWARALDYPVSLNEQLRLETAETADVFEETAYCSVQHFDADQAVAAEIVALITKRPTQPQASAIEAMFAPNSTSLSLAGKRHIASLFEAGQYQAAIADAEHAIQRFPEESFLWKVLGATLLQQGKHAESVTALQSGIALSPNDAELHNTLAASFHVLNNFSGAETHYLRAIQLAPRYFEAFYNLADMFFSLGKYTEAIDYFDRSLHLKSDFSDALTKRGIALHHLARLDEAEKSFRELVARSPRSFDAHCNLANTLRSKKSFKAAEQHYQFALSLNPHFVDALSNLSNLMSETSRYLEGEALSARALQIQPHHVGAMNNRALALRGLGRAEDAANLLRQTLKLDPTFNEARVNLAYVLLGMGNFEEGWQLHESRHSLAHIRRVIAEKKSDSLMWQGESLLDKTVLVWPEQGLGDQIQFIRYLGILNDEAPRKILVYCLDALHHLFSTLVFPNVVLIAEGETLPHFDYWVGVLSLPHCFKTTHNTIPCQAPYLSANPVLQEALRTKLHSLDGFKIGLCWSGSVQYKHDTERSIGIKQFEVLKAVPGIRLFNLQNNGRTAFLEAFGDLAYDTGHEIDQHTAPFEETAALIMNLDLVITCDTSIGHLAGALNRPVCLLLPHVADWRWMRLGESSPWYPHTRLFRQGADRSWNCVMQEVTQEVIARCSFPLPASSDVHENMSGLRQQYQGGYLTLPVSVGEYFDKLSILKIKQHYIKDDAKLRHVLHELDILSSLMPDPFHDNRELQALFEKLHAVNAAIWIVEDEIRACESLGCFDASFIALARSVYVNNDERARIKNKINLLLGSSIVEAKSYV